MNRQEVKKETKRRKDKKTKGQKDKKTKGQKEKKLNVNKKKIDPLRIPDSQQQDEKRYRKQNIQATKEYSLFLLQSTYWMGGFQWTHICYFHLRAASASQVFLGTHQLG